MPRLAGVEIGIEGGRDEADEWTVIFGDFDYAAADRANTILGKGGQTIKVVVENLWVYPVSLANFFKIDTQITHQLFDHVRPQIVFTGQFYAPVGGERARFNGAAIFVHR